MQLTFKIISSPGELDGRIRDFIAANDNDFYPTISSRRDLADFVQSVFVAKGRYVVCFDGKKIAGLTSIYLDHPSFITYYHYIAIDKDYRGKGISTTLYNMVHEICREYGVQWAIVKTWSTNHVSQAMFKKHGFFHLYTAEDDRSAGIHTYFYAKSFSQEWFRQSLKCIAIIGGDNHYALGNFVATISSIPKINSDGRPALPFIVTSGRDVGIIPGIGDNIVSHALALDGSNTLSGLNENIEIIDFAGITKRLVTERKKKWMLVAESGSIAKAYFGINDLHFPANNEQKRVDKIIEEIKTGRVSPAYYKSEIAAIASLNDCKGVLLGVPGLHTMFSFDKVFHGIEIFDPWLELAIIIQNNRMNFKPQIADNAAESLHTR